MRILMLEDASMFARSTATSLEKAGHIVKRVTTVSEANGYKVGEEFDCLIVDLNMKSIGLQPELVARTQHGLFTGWVWLRDVVFPHWPQMRSRSIVYTAYYAEFRERLPSEDTLGVPFVDKTSGGGDLESGDLALKRVVREIAAKGSTGR